jgi:ADP-heptose:LPS heptosyltransferase
MAITAEKMRWIDNVVGKPVCYLLTVYSRLTRLVPRKETRLKAILFTKYLGMGSIVHATPLIRSVKNAYPDARLLFLTFSDNGDFIKSLGLVDEVRCIRTDNLLFFLVDVLRSIRYLRKQKIDCVLNMEFFSKFGAILSFLSGARLTVGYYLKEPWRSRLLSHKVYYNHYKHIAEIFMALGYAIDAGSKDLALEKPLIPPEGKRYIHHFYEEHGINNTHWKIVVNINTSGLFLNRAWPLTNFSTLIEKIITTYGAYIILIGGKGDIPRVEAVVTSLGNHPKAVNLAGKTSVAQLLALMEQVDLVITNDSGPLHLAVMMGTPTISFFGPESPLQYGPHGDNHTVLYKGYYCSPCLHVYNEKNSRCTDNICLKHVSVDEVFAAVERHHAKREHPSHEKLRI